MSLWMRGGKIIVDASGKLIECDHCPCGASTIIISYLPATKTASFYILGVVEDEWGIPEQIFPAASEVNSVRTLYGSDLLTLFPGVPLSEWYEWCTRLTPPLDSEDSATFSGMVEAATIAATNNIAGAQFMINTSARPRTVLVSSSSPTTIQNAVSCSGHTTPGAAERDRVTQTTIAPFVAAENAPVKLIDDTCYVGDSFSISINGTTATIPLVTDATQYGGLAVPQISTSFGELPAVVFSPECYAAQAFDPDTGQTVVGQWPNGAFANDSNYFPIGSTLDVSIRFLGVSSWRPVTATDPADITNRCP